MFSDLTMVNLIPPNGRADGPKILPTDRICKDTQTTTNQTEGNPRSRALAGSAISLRYQENGHVTLPENQPGKPGNRGTVFIYGTNESKPDDSLLRIHKVWSTGGDGGDMCGKLLAVQDFDDGICYQVNNGTVSKQRQVQSPHEPDKLMGADL